MNIASAELLQRAAQGTTDALLRRRQLDQQLQEALQRNSLEEATKRIQEARYAAQGEHYVKIEADNAAANRIREENIAANAKKYGMTDAAKAAAEANDSVSKASASMHNAMVQMAKDGYSAQDIADNYKASIAPYGDLTDKIMANSGGALILAGKFDPQKLAAQPFFDEKGIPMGPQSGRAGSAENHVFAETQNQVKADQAQLDAGQKDDEEGDDWTARQAALSTSIKKGNDYLDWLTGHRPDINKTTTGTKSNPIPGLPAVTNSSTNTTSFGGPTPATNVPRGTIPPNTAPLPQAAPNPAVPGATPSATVSPGLTTPANPQAGGTMTVFHPKTKQMGTIDASDWPKMQAAGWQATNAPATQ